MADHIWTVLCSKHLTDPESKIISLIDVTEKIYVGGGNVGELLEQAKSQGNKGIQFDVKMQIVTWWIRSDPTVPETVALQLTFASPSGEQLYRQGFEVDLEEEAVSRRTVIRFDKLWVTEFGRYWFMLEKQSPARGKKERIVARVPLEIDRERPD